MIKYLVFPGWIVSKNDREAHFISSRRLMELYGVRRDECHIFNALYDENRNFTGLIPLMPCYNGDYKRMPNPIMPEVIDK